jgi:hypothetical protein
VILLRVSLSRLVNRLSSLGHYRSLQRAAAVAGGVATSACRYGCLAALVPADGRESTPDENVPVPSRLS